MSVYGRISTISLLNKSSNAKINHNFAYIIIQMLIRIQSSHMSSCTGEYVWKKGLIWRQKNLFGSKKDDLCCVWFKLWNDYDHYLFETGNEQEHETEMLLSNHPSTSASHCLSVIIISATKWRCSDKPQLWASRGACLFLWRTAVLNINYCADFFRSQRIWNTRKKWADNQSHNLPRKSVANPENTIK